MVPARAAGHTGRTRKCAEGGQWRTPVKKMVSASCLRAAAAVASHSRAEAWEERDSFDMFGCTQCCFDGLAGNWSVLERLTGVPSKSIAAHPSSNSTQMTANSPSDALLGLHMHHAL